MPKNKAAKSQAPSDEQPPTQKWWPWSDVVSMAEKHGLQPRDILVADKFVDGRWASNHGKLLYHVNDASIDAAVRRVADARAKWDADVAMQQRRYQ